jgi:hypothetical protein
MTETAATPEDSLVSNRRQRLYVYYLTAVLMDLVVLNLFTEYWDAVVIDSFSISLLAAILLQLMLKVSIAIEHKVGSYVQDRHGNRARILSAWAILFISKLIILQALSWVFAGDVKFLGAYHGLIAFLVVVIVMLVAEAMMRKVYQLLSSQSV